MVTWTTDWHDYCAQTVDTYWRRLLAVFQAHQVFAMAPVTATIFSTPQDPVIVAAELAVVWNTIQT
jgi:hypothetical protein